MAQKRMFDKDIVDSDTFLDMPLTTQALYFHLSMRADDEGFVNNPRRIMRMIGINDDDMKLLISKKFAMIFESGVIVISHWHINNTHRKDRSKPTNFIKEKECLVLNQDKTYSFKNNFGLPSGNQVATKRQPSEFVENAENVIVEGLNPNGNQMATNGCHRVDKNRIEKNILEESNTYIDISSNEMSKLKERYLIFLKMLKEKNKVITKTTIIEQTHSLAKLSLNDALSIIDYSIMNNYPVLYFDRVKNTNYSNKQVIGNTDDWYSKADEPMTAEDETKIKELLNSIELQTNKGGNE